MRYVLYRVYRGVVPPDVRPFRDVDGLVVFDRQLPLISDAPLKGRVLDARLSADGRYVSYSAYDTLEGRIVDRITAGEVFLKWPPNGSLFPAALPFTSDGRYVNGNGIVYEIATGRPLLGSPTGSMSPEGRYVSYQCGVDRRAGACLRDQLTGVTSRLPPIADPPRGMFTSDASVVDNLGRVAYNVGGGDIQMTCGSYFVPPSAILTSSLGATLTAPLTVSSGDACDWSAQSNAPWITITSPATGTGSATITYVVASNPAAGPRTGTLTVAGQTIVVTEGQNPAAAPGQPSALRGSPLFSPFVYVTWVPPVDGGPVAGYVVEGGSRPGLSDRMRLQTGPETWTVIPDAIFRSSVNLYLRVRATNQSGESIASNEVPLRTLPNRFPQCFLPPNAPGEFGAVVTGSTVTLAWKQPDSANGSGAILSYVIEAGTANGVTNVANFVTRNTDLGLAVPGVSAGTYFARVRAINDCGEGMASNEIVVVVR